MEDLSQEITKLSKINSAGLINLRISNLWQNVNRYASSGKFAQWNSELDRIWCELVGDVEPTKPKKKKKNDDKEEKGNEEIFYEKPKKKKKNDDKEEKGNEEIFYEFDEKIAEEFKKSKTKKGFSQHSDSDKDVRLLIYKAIQKKEVFLRRLMNKQGKGTAYQEESDWD